MTAPWDALAATWTVLAQVVREPPSARALVTLHDDAARGVWPLPGGRVAEGLGLLATEVSLQAVADDHFRLFRGPGERLAVPWASVYLSEERLMFGEETLAVREAYARHGLAVPHLNQEPDDHIALELEFLATLLVRAIEAVDAGDPDAAAALVADHDAFCRDHLLPFAPAFFTAVEEHAGTAFYRGVGVLGSAAMARLAAELADA